MKRTTGLLLAAALSCGCRSTQVAEVPAPAPPGTAASMDAPEKNRILWSRQFRKKGSDVGDDMLATEDGSLYVVGTTDLDMTGAGSTGDVYLMKTDADGKLLWDRTFGGPKAEEGLSIDRASDGNFVIAGKTSSFGAAGTDAWLLKVDPEGNELWSRRYGGALDEMASVVAMADGGFMLWGYAVDNADFVADPGAAGYGGFAGRSNILLVRLDAEGNERWSRKIGGRNNLLACEGLADPDGGFAVLASLVRFPEAGDDIYMVKVDENGNTAWERTWTEETMVAYDLVRASDGGYLVAGSFGPADDATRVKTDYLFVKVDAKGDETWRSAFGDPDMVDCAYQAAGMPDGGFVSVGDWVKDNSGTFPQAISIVRIDPLGKLLWRDVLRPTVGRHYMLRTILPLPDGNCLVLGSVMSGDKFGIMLLKVDSGDRPR